MTEAEKVTVLTIGTRSAKHGRQATHPEIECQLFNKLREKRRD